MPDTPDFEQIALDAIILRVTSGLGWAIPAGGLATLQVAIAEQLRLVWNARGAADLTKLETELMAVMGAKSSGPYVKNLGRALRSLDR